jgi:hypothetical protein
MSAISCFQNLLQKVIHIYNAFYEWVNPITDQPEGSFLFRTGISAIRTAIADILEKIKGS